MSFSRLRRRSRSLRAFPDEANARQWIAMRQYKMALERRYVVSVAFITR